MRPLRIFTIVWGDKHLDWMNRALIKSLAWPENKASVQHARWTIYGNQEEAQKIYGMATKVLPFHQIELKEIPFDKGNVNMLGALMNEMRACLLEKSQLLVCPPDTIFSEGSIKTLLTYGEQEGTCVAVPHPRVTTQIMDHLTTEPMKTAKLVDLALNKCPHKCWSLSDQDMPLSAVHQGGIAWQKHGENLWTVCHRLPTTYLANFIDDDRRFFSRNYKADSPNYGFWDWAWPSILFEAERVRTIGSSDLAFIAEVTDEWKNVPSVRLRDRYRPDSFFRDEPHNKINRQYYSVFRGEA